MLLGFTHRRVITLPSSSSSIKIDVELELEPLNNSNGTTTTTNSWKKWGMGAALVALVGLGYNSTSHRQSSSSDGVDLFGHSSHKQTKSHKKEKHGQKSLESAPLFDEQGELNFFFHSYALYLSPLFRFFRAMCNLFNIFLHMKLFCLTKFKPCMVAFATFEFNRGIETHS